MTNPPKDGLAEIKSGTEPRPRPELRAVDAGARTPALEPPQQDPAQEVTEDATVAARRARRAKRAAPARRRAAPARKPTPARRSAPARRKSAAGRQAEIANALPEVVPARLRSRHWIAIASFLLLVVLPFAAAIGYLWTRAADQYHSGIAFSIRSEDSGAATAGLLGALTQIGAGSASDADILFDYIRSQEIVAEIDAALDLRAIFNRAERDPVFTLGENPSIEALLAQWRRMVEVSYDSTAGIIHVRANAFTPEDAQAISQAILARSSTLVNQLSDQAREDAVRFAREVLNEAEANLREVRQSLAEFRRSHNIVDPTADVAGQSGLLSALNQELAQALVDRDVLVSYTAEGDQRVVQTDRRIAAITARIEDERSSLDLTGVSGSLPEVVGRYEQLSVDLEFANTAYTQALAGLAAARAEARRQSRYLAPHLQPTLATSSLYPRRVLLASLAGLFLVLGWSVLMLLHYNVRDNR